MIRLFVIAGMVAVTLVLDLRREQAAVRLGRALDLDLITRAGARLSAGTRRWRKAGYFWTLVASTRPFAWVVPITLTV